MKDSNPTVTVVMPVYNGHQHLREAIDSVLRSSFDAYELLLIDDGSTDESQSICTEYANANQHVRFIQQPAHVGLANTLNVAIRLAKGKYICRLNQDDCMNTDRIEKQFQFLSLHPDVVALGSAINLFFEDGTHQILPYLESDEAIRKAWHYISPFSDTSVMYRRDVALEIGGYMQQYWPADDTHLWMRMALRGKLMNLTEPLVRVRWHSNAASIRYFRTMATNTFKMHVYAHRHVQPAPPLTQMYWVAQLLAGHTLSPMLNWKIYRVIKRLITSVMGTKKSRDIVIS